MTWVIPTQTELRGIGTGGPSGSTYPYNTIIHNAGSQTTVLQMGASTGGPYFGVVISDLTVDCVGVANCTGIVNDESEENSAVHNVEIWNAPVIGLHVSAYNPSDSTHPAATNSGPYQNIQVAYVAATCSCNSAIGVQVDGPGSLIGSADTAKVVREFNDITVSGGGRRPIPPADTREVATAPSLRASLYTASRPPLPTAISNTPAMGCRSARPMPVCVLPIAAVAILTGS